MEFLLDTHTFLWWDSSDRQLGKTASASISDPANRIIVSAASIWEIAIKRKLGRLHFSGSPSQAVARNGFLAMPILNDYVEAAAELPPFHHDPFDRMLKAQALLRRLVLITSDRLIAQYEVSLLSAT